MTDLRPIETQYKGYRFRSRLEARWAVFFDTMEVKWEYEAEGFNLNGVLYLPDFVLNHGPVRTFVEVKPENWFEGDRTNDRQKWSRLAEAADADVLVLLGSPGQREWWEAPLGDTCEERRRTGGGVLYKTILPSGLSTVYLCECRRCGAFAYSTHWMNYARLFCPPSCESERMPIIGPNTRRSIHAARSARFEHGESPQWRGDA